MLQQECRELRRFENISGELPMVFLATRRLDNEGVFAA